MEGLKDAGIQAYFLPVPFASIDLPIRGVGQELVEWFIELLLRRLGNVGGKR